MSHRILTSLAIVLGGAIAALAQANSPTRFEVASVRPNTADDHIVTVNVGPGGRFTARGYTLVLLIQRAYGVMDWNVDGGPAWIRTDRFDVAAQADITGNLTERQLQIMLRPLLAERFKLKLHSTSKEMPGYALTVARGGAKVKPAAGTEEHPDTFRMNNAGLSGQGISMQNLARFVAGKLGLVAVDQTGLKGLYDLKVDWKPETISSTSGLSVEDVRDAFRLTVFSALEDQLGLKFAAKKISVQTLVIDSAEKASASEN